MSVGMMGMGIGTHGISTSSFNITFRIVASMTSGNNFLMENIVLY